MPAFVLPRRTILLFLLLALVFNGCTCNEKPHAVVLPAAATCVMQNEAVADAAPLANTTIVPGTLHASYSVDISGQLSLTIPLDVAAGRGAPALQLAYDGTNQSGATHRVSGRQLV